MSQSVMIKSNKYGINLVLDPNIPFVELLKDVIEKFKASEKFFKNAELAISFEGRKPYYRGNHREYDDSDFMHRTKWQ